MRSKNPRRVTEKDFATKTKTPANRKGSVLLIVLGILSILSMLGTALVFLTRQDLKESKSYMDQTKAQFAAESGIEDALARLYSFSGVPSRWDFDFNTLPATPSTPLEFLSQCSFGKIDTDGDGKKDCAGKISNSYMNNGDVYRLRVSSSQNKLNINDSNQPLNWDTDPHEDQLYGTPTSSDLHCYRLPPNGKDPDWLYPGDAGYDSQKGKGEAYPKAPGRLWNIIRELCVLLFPANSNLHNAVPNAIFSARAKLPGDQFEYFDQLKSALVPSVLDAGQYQLLESYFTLHSWGDPNTIRPTFQWHISLPPAVDPDTLIDDHSGGELVITSPAPMSSLNKGETYTIRWACTNPGAYDKVFLTLYKNGVGVDWFGWGSDWRGIPNTGSFDWTVPATLANASDYRIRIHAYNASMGSFPTCDSGLLAIGEIFEPRGILSSDPLYFAGDFSWGEIPALIMPTPDLSARSVFGTVSNGEDNSRDIYLYSDMQTLHYELEARSPVNVNNCDLNLLKALIRPLKGWYLKEAPNAGEAPTSEDWSQPAINNSFLNSSSWCVPDNHHPWYAGRGKITYLEDSDTDTMSGVCTIVRPDLSRFYCFDENEKAHVNLMLDPATGWETSSAEYCKKSNRYGRLMEVFMSVAIADAVAKKIHDKIHTFSGPGPGDPDPDEPGGPIGAERMSNQTVSSPLFTPFTTWDAWEDFILDLADGDGTNDVAGFTIQMAHMVIANFNPNSRINDFNPNKRFHLHVDKSQLSNYTTEFCFSPCGYFDLESLGEIRAPGKKLIAKNKIQTTIKILEQFRVSSQSQFIKGYDPENDRDSRSFFSASNGESPSKGLRFQSGIVDTSHNGNSLQSYPEPERKDALNASEYPGFMRPSEFDGYIMLSAMLPKPQDIMAATSNKYFYADFNGSMDILPLATGSLLNCAEDTNSKKWISSPLPFTLIQSAIYSGGANWASDPCAQQPGNSPNQNHLTRNKNESRTTMYPGNLYPDGAFSETGRSLKYVAKGIGNPGNAGLTGALQFWIKPCFNPAHSNRIRQMMTLTSPQNPDPGMDLNSYAYSNYWSQDFSLYYFSHGGSRVNPIVDDSMPIYNAEQGGEWLSTRAFYFHSTRSTEFSRETYGIGSTTANQSWRPAGLANPANHQYNFEAQQWTHYAMSWGGGNIRMAINGQPVEEELRAGIYGTGSYSGGAAYIRFGEASSAPWRNQPADSTFDGIVSSDKYEEYADLQLEFSYGRYYNMNDAVYTSPTFDLKNELSLEGNQTLSLHSIAWTMYWPKPANPDVLANAVRFNDNLYGPNSDLFTTVRGVEQGMDGTTPLYPLDPMWRVWGQKWAPCSVDIGLPHGSGFFYESSGLPKMNMPCFAGGSVDDDWMNSPLRWKAGEKFQFKVHFNIEEGQTLLTSPILDDITFQFKLSNPKILYWNSSK